MFLGDVELRHDKMVGLVETMVKLPRDLPKAKTPHEREIVKRQVAATDRQIDALMYDWSNSGKCRPTAQLCGLTEDEVRIVGAGEK